MLDQAADVARRCVLRRFGKLRPLGCGELPFEVVEHEIEYVALALVQRQVRD